MQKIACETTKCEENCLRLLTYKSVANVNNHGGCVAKLVANTVVAKLVKLKSGGVNILFPIKPYIQVADDGS